ncbi:MAG: peroxidase [Pseudobacteriovorax sp.]|nr:peroxidase [Pseudobacteriovorax sp.]
MIGRPVWIQWPKLVKAVPVFGVLVSLVILASTRESLLNNNMFETNDSYPEDVHCDDSTLTARTIDGTCNNLDIPAMGAAGIRFGRNVPLESTYGETGEELLTPNPRDISLELLTRDEFVPASTLNFLAASWIQFMTHDWISHGPNDDADPIQVPLADNDPFGTDCLEIKRTRKDVTSDPSAPATYKNVNTHWWDGSQIYGSDQATNNKVRSFVDGKLKLDEAGNLPTSLTGQPITGFTDNWWVGLSMLHQIFAKEHNAIADMLKSKYPEWNDQQLYDKARLINAALMAKIHTIEWTPAILDNPALIRAMNSNWYGVLGDEKRTKLRDTLKQVSRNSRFLDILIQGVTGKKNTLKNIESQFGGIERALNGLVGAPEIALYGTPYTLTEEFTAVYRMHPLLRDNVDIFDYRTGRPVTSIPLGDTRDGNAEDLMAELDQTNMWYSFGTTNPGALTLQNYPKFLQNIDIPLMGNIDLGAVDIIRDRERGVPRYNEFRRLIQLQPIRKFEDLTKDKNLLRKLKKVYNNDIEQIDLMVGSFAESVRPEGFGFGETSFQIFILNASRRLMSDRFFTIDYRPEVYTQEGLDWVEDSSMVSVIERHVPKLRPILRNADNAFKPWN